MLLLIVFNSCGSSSKTPKTLPDWVSDPSSSFSDRQYLMAVGSGDTYNEARSDAMLSLAQIFKASIDGTQNLYSDVLEVSKTNEDFTSKQTIRLINEIEIGTNEELQNAEVLTSDTGKDGVYYVLAGFNRSETADLYQSELSNNYERIDRNKLELEKTRDQFYKLRFLKENLLLVRINKRLSSMLEIIQPGSGTSALSQEVLIETRNAFNLHQQTMPVQINGLTEYENIHNALADAFLTEGFYLGTQNAVLLVDANYTAEETDINRNDADFVRWELHIQISRPDTDQTYTAFSVFGREGALNIQNAYQRASKAAVEQIEGKFRQYFSSEFLSNN